MMAKPTTLPDLKEAKVLIIDKLYGKKD